MTLDLLLHLRPEEAGHEVGDSIDIEGEHPIRIRFRPGNDALYATSAHLVNSIPTVIDAPPGIWPWASPVPLVPRHLRFEATERVDYRGRVVTPLDTEALAATVAEMRAAAVESIAVCFLFSFMNPVHERQARDVIGQVWPEVPVSISSEILPEIREYERSSTVVIDAYVKPVMGAYFENLEQRLASGGMECGVTSGPAGGVIGAAHLGEQSGYPNLLAIDVGGTSFEVSLIEGGVPSRTTEGFIEWGIPFKIPLVDVKSIGAGGGSIARIDPGGLIQVGPDSAGSEPGPVCYRKGGSLPTLTDAYVTIGLIDPAYFLGGRVRLDAGAAREAIRDQIAEVAGMTVTEAALGIVRVAEASMVGAMRIVSTQRGYDPRDYAMIAYGGAGPVSAVELARELGVGTVLVPRYLRRMKELDLATLTTLSEELVAEGEAAMNRIGVTAAPIMQFTADVRYSGQNFEVNVSFPSGAVTEATIERVVDSFHAEHLRLFGHHKEDEALEFVSLRLAVIATTEKPEFTPPRPQGSSEAKGRRRLFSSSGQIVEAPVFDRIALDVGWARPGALIIEEPDSTVVVRGTNDSTAIDDLGNIVVIREGLVALCRSMGYALSRTAYSPIFSEGFDFSCALFDGIGEMVAQAEFNPVHLGSMPYTVEWTVKEIGLDNLDEGDVILHNDPFRGGTHLTDFTMMAPVFYEGRLVAIPAVRGHQIDEGLIVPPVKVYRRGEPVKDIWDLILANIRVPKIVHGDFRAMFGSLKVAERRVQEYCRKYGPDTYAEATDEIKNYSERRMRAMISRLPDGTYEAADMLDDTGTTLDPVRVQCRLTIDGDTVTTDFSGSDPQVQGPINATYGVTASQVYTVLFQVSDPDMPSNHGAFRPIKIVAPPGSVVNAESPAAVFGGNVETSSRIMDVLLACFAQAVPDRVMGACFGTCQNFTGGSQHPELDEYSIIYIYHEGGWGGRASGDGLTAQINPVGNDMNQPVEIFESRFPWLYEEYCINENSGGPGYNRGGLGIRQRLRSLSVSSSINLIADRVKLPGSAEFVHATEAFGTVSPSKFAGKVIPRGTVVENTTTGGGGYGDPLDREPERVATDVVEGYVTAAAAESQYGVILRSDGSVDSEATLATRRKLRQKAQ
ncbi:5-oxoprolinase [Geodia barretti]|uniref:5-oxoprolinase n=1 Tax=Geodia barretti TaxID=519541 RepID=A0AA35TBE0_GEOBA|nr:5-oxoprolinase [Geodia barretti]